MFGKQSSAGEVRAGEPRRDGRRGRLGAHSDPMVLVPLPPTPDCQCCGLAHMAWLLSLVSPRTPFSLHIIPATLEWQTGARSPCTDALSLDGQLGRCGAPGLLPSSRRCHMPGHWGRVGRRGYYVQDSPLLFISVTSLATPVAIYSFHHPLHLLPRTVS